MKAVYFIRPVGASGPVKIGCSVSPTGRREALQAWSPLPLEIAAEIEGDFDLERRFHQHFLDQHRGYEWFDWSHELQATIEHISAGTFDISKLPQAEGSPLQRGKRCRTPEQKRQQSYSMRCTTTRQRSGGFAPPVCAWPLTDEKAALLDLYFADPEKHGIPPQPAKQLKRWIEVPA